MEATPMAGKHVMDIRLSRVPARASSSHQSWSSSAQHKGTNRPAASRGQNRGGSQHRNREGRVRDVQQKSSIDEEDEEDDETSLILDAYQDDRKGGRRHERSLNHLLNFHYAERAKAEAVSVPQRKLFTKPFRKEAFVQANYRFIVSSMGKSTTLVEDVNQPVEWELIEQVLLSSSVEYNCPICLDHPIAARITKCGHIYCAACILRYLGESAVEWRRCPICFESVTRAHLKSAAIQTHSAVSEGDVISLVLLQRAKSSSVLLRRSQWATALHKDQPRKFDDPQAIYARIVVANDLLALLARQEAEISEAVSLGRASMDESLPYLLIAQEELQARQTRLKAELALTKGPATNEETPVSDGNDEEWGTEEETRKNKQKNANDAASPPPAAAKPANATPETKETQLQQPPQQQQQLQQTSQQQPPASKEETVCIFQATDGQLIFLHPLNVRCLLREFNSVEHFPENVTGRVLEVEELVLSEALRKRHKHLAHLPLSCTISFVELDLSHLLSPPTIAAFHTELTRRADARAARLRERQLDLEESQKAPAYRPEDFTVPNSSLLVSDEVKPGDSAAAFEYPPLRASTTAVPVAATTTKPAAIASAWRSNSSPNAAAAVQDDSPPDHAPSTLSFKAALSSEPPPPKLDRLPRKNKKQVLAFSNSGARKYNG